MKKILEKKWASYSIATCSAVILYMFLSHINPVLEWFSSLWQMLNPVVIGGVTAYLLNPVMNFLERKVFHRIKNQNIRHMLGVLVSVLFLLLVLTAVIMMVVPSLVSGISDLISTFNRYGYSNITALIEELNGFNLGINIDTSNLDKYLDSALSTVYSTVKNNLSLILSQVNDISSSVINVIIGFVIGVYLLVGKKSVTDAVAKLRKAVSTKKRYKAESEFWSRCHEIFIQYIGCSLLDAFIIGSVNAVFMLIFRMDNVTLISVTVAVFNLLPTFGPIIGGLLGALFLLITDPGDALVFIIFTVILQAVDGYIIKPKLFSSSLGLSPVVSLISIILASKMFGLVGIVLAIPVTAVLVMLYSEKLLPWFSKKTAIREQAEAAEDQTVKTEKENTEIQNQ